MGPIKIVNYVKLFTGLHLKSQKLYRHVTIQYRQASIHNKPAEDPKNERLELAPASHARKILEREFPNHYRDGQFVSRLSYVEFIDEALHKAKELGLEKDLNLYKELLSIFPPGKFYPTDSWEFGGFFHAPQQLAATRIFFQMNLNGLKVDKDFEKLVVRAFSKKSDVWLLVARHNYWSMKLRNLDDNPLPDELPREPHQLAKLAIMRMSTDHKSIVTVTNTSSVPDSVDKTWVVSCQSPTQKSIIDHLDKTSTLYIEDGGLTYVGSQYLSYFILKYYVDEATAESKKPKLPEFNFNTMKMSFYGKPIEEKLASFIDQHYADGSYILAICATGTSSQDSLLSWLKILQRRNPKLSDLNVVFKMSRPSPEIIEYHKQDGEQSKENSSTDKSYHQQPHT